MRIIGVLTLLSILALQQVPSSQPPSGAGYYCPMHPDVTAAAPGSCSRCGMKLIAGNPLDAVDYILEVQTSPRAVKAREKFDLILKARNPETGQVAKEFEFAHEKLMHLFVVSQDLQHFYHLHPDAKPDGSFTIKLDVPQAGYYKLFAEFLPKGGTLQVNSRPLITAGYAGDLASMIPKLTADLERIKTFEGMTVEMTSEPAQLIAGQQAHLNYVLADKESGQPINDLQPYLGAWGHTLVLNEDMTEYVHSHPSESIPAEADPKTVRGGPTVSFEAFFPKPGMYRVWTQFMRSGKLTTVSFTVRVARLGLPN